ncbi:hypothetical protein AOCH_003933 [Aspergillus ochraceoroseus]|uniref:YjgH family protein n=1 Tax=Aspergillus ochraceoroseus TaxID=138278 RepID=A0A0F8WPC9_9EURO|nr:hypothetical protein AOCH_003933 [Aspergillus ochraceoroseus]
MPTSGSPKQVYSTSSPFEERIGYYRAVRHGQHVRRTAADARGASGMYQGSASLGGKGAENVVRVRMFVSRPEDCTAVGEGFTEVLGRQNHPGVGAAATMLVVRDGFVDTRMLVEIEVDAIVEEK